MKDETLLEHIVLDANVMVGKPIIRGTRLTVDFILNLLAHGATEEEILAEYTSLTKDDVRACILFAAEAIKNTDFMPLTAKTV
jgi:uncharacterized protein (DUF433 family)